MNSEFCISCGHKNMFAAVRPKFCSGCGKPFNTAMAGYSAPSVDHDSHDDEEDFSPHHAQSTSKWDLNKLKQGIGVHFNKTTTSADDLIAQGSGPANYKPRPAPVDLKGLKGKALIQKNISDCAKAPPKDIDE